MLSEVFFYIGKKRNNYRIKTGPYLNQDRSPIKVPKCHNSNKPKITKNFLTKKYFKFLSGV